MTKSGISESQNILAIAIMEMGRMKKGQSFSPSEVVKWIYPESWDHFMDDVMEEVMLLDQMGKIEVTQNQIQVSTEAVPVGEVRITCKF